MYRDREQISVCQRNGRREGIGCGHKRVAQGIILMGFCIFESSCTYMNIHGKIFRKPHTHIRVKVKLMKSEYGLCIVLTEMQAWFSKKKSQCSSLNYKTKITLIQQGVGENFVKLIKESYKTYI